MRQFVNTALLKSCLRIHAKKCALCEIWIALTLLIRVMNARTDGSRDRVRFLVMREAVLCGHEHLNDRLRIYLFKFEP